MRLVYIVPFLAVATTVIAAEATDPTVKARQELMEHQRAAVMVLGGMAQGKMAFDAAKAGEARTALIDTSAQIAAAFKDNATDPETEALPAIWDNYDDFTAKATALHAAAEGMDAASLDGVKAGMGAIGAACGACHKAYRMEK